MKLMMANRAITLFLVLPLLVGLIGTLLPSFNYLPALDQHQFSIIPWLSLWQTPELMSSIKLTLFSGISATLISLFLATSTVAYFYHSKLFRLIETGLAPILAIPHTAIAIGLLFLLSPSGWIIRIFSPWLTSFERPPNWTTIQDPYSLSLIIGLVIKETPYLLFIIMASLKQLDVDRILQAGRAMGYAPITTWKKVIFPALYPLIKLPIFIVLAFSLTVVDLALIIGPNTPSTFAVTLFRWFQDADLTLRFSASAGAIVLMLLVVSCCVIWEFTHRIFNSLQRESWTDGRRLTSRRYSIKAGAYLYLLSMLITGLSIIVLFFWAIARRWRFPDAFPSSWSWRNIQSSTDLLTQLSINTLLIAGFSTAIALFLSIIVLEYKRNWQLKNSPTAPFIFDRLIYIPMLLPQIGFLFGIQILLIWSNLSGHIATVIALHLLYVLPYVYLTLNGSYLAYDQDYYTQAVALTRRPIKSFISVKLAMLKAPLLSAFAIGISVSIAQYLPTLIAGEGRISTLTTEAIALASNGDRKKVSLLALLQALFPFIVFVIAMLLPKIWTACRVSLLLKLNFFNRQS